MEGDRELLLGVLARQAGMIGEEQLAEAATSCLGWPHEPMADWLVERGWIDSDDRARLVERLERTLDEHQGDATAALRACARDWDSGPPQPGAEATTAEEAPTPRSARLFDSTVAHPLARTEQVEGLGPSGATAPGEIETRHRYVLSKLHASGGIGRVWLARDDEIGRLVALKELRPERTGDETSTRRFVDEARITGQLEHPGIVPVYEFLPPDDGRPPFYTMRFVRGRTLGEAARVHHERRGKGAEDPVGRLALLNAFVTACHTVAFAHARGFIHRDLKGSNIVLGDFGEVVLLDWGLAKRLDEGKVENLGDDGFGPVRPDRDATLQGQVLGTPAYMAPEQAEGRHDQVDRRTDVYGLGAILYEILTGRPPFVGKDTDEILRRVKAVSPERPRWINRHVPRPLEAICRKAMARSPEDRYAGALELAEEVQRWIADQPVTAYRERFGERLRRSARRHRTLTVTGLAVALTALVTLTTGAVMLQRERDLSDRRDRMIKNYELAMEAMEDMLEEVEGPARPPAVTGRGEISLTPTMPFPVAVVPDEPPPGVGVQLEPEPPKARTVYTRVGRVLQRLGDVLRGAPEPVAPEQNVPVPPPAAGALLPGEFPMPPGSTVELIPPRERLEQIRRKYAERFRELNPDLGRSLQMIGD